VAIATDPAMENVVQRASTADTSFGVVQADTSAPRWAQVRAVGTEGIVGEWSTPRPLRVIRYQLPSGALVARDGAVVLPPGSVVPLVDANDVEVAYENVRSLDSRIPGIPLYWSKLTGPLRLHDEAPLRIVHLRDASIGLDAEVQLVLARRELRASVDLTPKEARSGDPIDARVMVWDPSGRVDPMGEKVSLEAMYDLDPLPVSWRRTGNVWTARVSTRWSPRPSVVRVVVKDGLGGEIGRGFVEIARPVAQR
jgi:hypothetical protein